MDRKTTIIYLLVFSFILSSASALNINWAKVEDSGLMRYIEISPLTSPQEVLKSGYADFSVRILPEFKQAYEFETVGITSKLSFEDWVALATDNVYLPLRVKQSELPTKNEMLNLKSVLNQDKNKLVNGIITVQLKDIDIKTTSILFGWGTETWELVYYADVDIGFYVNATNNSIWCFLDCDNYSQGENFTTFNKTVWGNVTGNTTEWKINGTTQEVSPVQIWTQIHENATNISIIFANVSRSYNYTGINLTTTPLLSGDLIFPDRLVNFENSTIGNCPDWWVCSGTTYEVSSAQASEGTQSLMMENDIGSTRPDVAYTPNETYIDATFTVDFYIDHYGNGVPAWALGDNEIFGNLISFSVLLNGSIQWYNQSDTTYLIANNTPILIGTWYTLHTVLYMDTDSHEVYLDGDYLGVGWFREYDHEVEYFNFFRSFYNDDASTTEIYFDNLRFYNETYAPSQVSGEPFSGNVSYEILWTTGWKYCTENSNCTSDAYCKLDPPKNSMCVADKISTLEFISTPSTIPAGDYSNSLIFKYGGTTPDNTTIINVELWNSSNQTNLIANDTAVYSFVTDSWTFTFENVSERNNAYILATATPNNPEYANVTTYFETDFVTANIEIIYPDAFEKIYAKRTFPRIRLSMSSFINLGTCEYKSNTRRTDTFTVSNNITYNSQEIRSINGMNTLRVICIIGDLTLTEFVEYGASVIPDTYLLGINLNSHLVNQLALYKTKEFLWIVLPIFASLMLILSLIIFFVHKVFIGTLHYILRRNSK